MFFKRWQRKLKSKVRLQMASFSFSITLSRERNVGNSGLFFFSSSCYEDSSTYISFEVSVSIKRALPSGWFFAKSPIELAIIFYSSIELGEIFYVTERLANAINLRMLCFLCVSSRENLLYKVSLKIMLRRCS